MPSHEEASSIIDRWFRAIEDQSPINLCFMTRPISRSMLGRIETLEGIYNRNIIYRFLIRKIHPVIVFLSLTTSLSYLATRLYRRSTRLVLTLVGVLYPIQRSWNLIRQREGTTEELNSWLTYWMIYGSFQGYYLLTVYHLQAINVCMCSAGSLGRLWPVAKKEI